VTPGVPELGVLARRTLRAAFGLLWLVIAGAAVYSAAGLGDSRWTPAVRDWASSVVYVVVALIVVARVARVRERRGPWAVLAAGLSLYALGNLLWSLWLGHMPDPPIPSVCDVLWLALYPCAYVGLAWLAHGRRFAAGVWLDGIIAGLGLTAVGAALVLRPVLDSAEGSTAAVLTNLAYPIGDLLLAALVVGILALRGRLERGWALLGAGFILLTAGDCIYLLQVLAGKADASLVANVFYMSGVAVLAAAAWAPMASERPERLEGFGVVVLPAAFVGAALGLLLYDQSGKVGPVASTLATLTIVATIVRTGIAFRDVRDASVTRRLALTDDLTGLPNRRLFARRLDEALEAAGTGPFALLIVDLDQFKELNDTLGHAAGDAVLREVGARLAGAIGPRDTLARLGGDEFGVVLGAPTDEVAALAAAGRLQAALAAPFPVRDLRLRVAASVGIAVHPQHGATAESLHRHADVAMYDAKGTGAGPAVYDAGRDPHSRERLALASELPGAIERGEIEVFLQPKACARTRAIVGAEALVRWRHPDRGLLAPEEFVATAERSGLSRALTRSVLNQALAQGAARRAEGHDLHIAVNATVADLLDTGFPGEVAAALDRHGVPAAAVTIEITETSILSDPLRIGQVLEALRALGVGLALDDFGTGYSALSHLRTLPVTEVKVDRSFVSSLLTEPADAAIVEATLQLAQRLGITAVAEGVEDDATWARLAELGCDLIQGYALARPLPAGEFAALLAATPTVAGVAAG
jgi:diguanylate cyclase (GGDEF)-like protein